jgi:2,4-dienoyl-CoA reductase (NADPH2)
MLQIARQPMRHRFADLVAWYEKQMRLCQVELVFGAELAAGDVPDAGALVVATGAIPDRLVRHRSAPYQPGLPGHDRGHVAPVEDVLSGILKPEGRIVLLDDCDDWKSLGTALFLARAGHEVHLVTRQATLGARLAASGQLGLVRKQFAELGIRVHAGSQVLSWSGDGVELMDLNSKEHLSMASDWLVTATTSRANSGLSEALTRSGRPHFLVGDCAAPRNLGDAVREGRTVAGGIEGNEA